MNKKTQNSTSHDNDIEKSLKSKEIDHIYFNEFALGTSSNDVFIVLRCHGREEAILNLSHITAKSLALSLTEAINDFEESTDQKILVHNGNDKNS